MEIFYTLEYNKTEVNILLDHEVISFQPLRDYCYFNHIKLTHIAVKCGVSPNVVTKINNDSNIEIYSLAKMLKELELTFDQAIKFTDD